MHLLSQIVDNTLYVQIHRTFAITVHCVNREAVHYVEKIIAGKIVPRLKGNL